jgi:hypothetical protein
MEYLLFETRAPEPGTWALSPLIFKVCLSNSPLQDFSLQESGGLICPELLFGKPLLSHYLSFRREGADLATWPIRLHYLSTRHDWFSDNWAILGQSEASNGGQNCSDRNALSQVLQGVWAIRGLLLMNVFRRCLKKTQTDGNNENKIRMKPSAQLCLKPECPWMIPLSQEPACGLLWLT